MNEHDTHVAAAVAASGASVEGRHDFDATRAERESIINPERVNFEVGYAYVVMTTAMPYIARYVDELEKRTLVEPGLFSKLAVYGRAAIYAVQQERALKSENTQHSPLVAKLEATYQRFFRIVTFLVDEGLLDRSILTAARTGTGVRDRAIDVGTMCVEFSTNEHRIRNASPLTMADVEAASKLSHDVLASLANREAISEAQQLAMRDRQLASVLLLRTWNEFRRGIHWLRWHEGDADTLAPSFNRYESRSDRSREDGSDNGNDNNNSNSNSRKPADDKPADPMPADKREDLERSGAASKRVPQEDPF